MTPAWSARLTVVGACGLLISCASAPPGDYMLRLAREYRESGEPERALRYTETAMQRDPLNPTDEEIALHVAILRDQGRHAEADAFAEFAARYAAGEETDTTATVPTRTECAKLARAQRWKFRLIREYGEPPVRVPFEPGRMIATYAIDVEGRPIRIRVVRARSPASAWLIIDSISNMRIWTSRLESLDPALLPIPNCLYSVEVDPS